MSRLKSRNANKPKKIPKDELVNLAVPYSFAMEQKKSWLKLRSLRNKWNSNTYPEKMVLVNMEMQNGDFMTFTIKLDGDRFIFSEGTYLWDENSKYYNINSKLWMNDYHEGFALPVKRKIPLNELKKAIKDEKSLEDIEYSFNPKLLEDFQNTTITEKILKGEELDAFIKRMTLMIFISLFETTIILLLILFKSGALKNLG